MEHKNNEIPKSGNQECVLWAQWVAILSAIFSPMVALPLILAVVGMWSVQDATQAYKADVGKGLSSIILMWQIITGLAMGIVGGTIWKIYSEKFNVNVLAKKGESAVRHLTLTRQKAGNAVERVKKGANTQEVQNLLALLEKDVSNAILEWHDVFPAVGGMQQIYLLLGERERGLALANEERERLEEELKKFVEISDEKEEKQRQLDEKEKEVARLSKQVEMLRTTNESLTFIAPYAGKVLGNTYDINRIGGVTGGSSLMQLYGLNPQILTDGRLDSSPFGSSLDLPKEDDMRSPKNQ